MSYQVSIKGTGKIISVSQDETILEAALDAGIDYPFGCQSGNCGACKSRLLTGEVTFSDYSEYALTDEERDQGQILACSSMPIMNCDVAWLDLEETIQHKTQNLDCTITNIEQATHDIVVVQCQPNLALEYSAGQYASPKLQGQPERDFSMAGNPSSETLEFHIRAIENGKVSSAAQKLLVGDKFTLSGPMGLAYLRELHTGPIIAAAGGSGLAPIKSIVETGLAKGMKQPISLYFGARDERDLYFVDHFESLAAKHSNFNFFPVLSEPTGKTTLRTGFLHKAITDDHSSMDGTKIYTAGPPPMVDAIRDISESLGARAEDLHADPFYTVHELADQVSR